MIVPVILSGGSGTRLWPQSRKQYPKQFLKLLSDKSLFQSTVARLAGLNSATAPIIIANKDHRFLVKEQLDVLGLNTLGIFLEHTGRNTAPAITIAALHAITEFKDKNQDPILLVLPSDHLIKNVEQFYLDVETAVGHAATNKLVTFGVLPTHPNTGFGYIEKGDSIDSSSYKVNSFKEKPDIVTAEKYQASKQFLWNSGMFMFKASTYIDQIEMFAPDIYSACKKAIDKSINDLGFVRLNQESFDTSPTISIDYAVMEKTSDAVVVEAKFEWSDIGSWSGLKEVTTSDKNNNVFEGDVVAINSSNCLVRGESRLIALLGVKDAIIIDTKDAILVADLNDAQSVGSLVVILEELNRSEGVLHREVHRPWGKYDCIDSGERFQVKRITVNPGAELSAQKHRHRAEHWVVVSGRAEVTCDTKVFNLEKDQSTYIPLGSVHRLKNPLNIPLKLIEVQSGDYLGEDDIVRLDDRYGRADS